MAPGSVVGKLNTLDPRRNLPGLPELYMCEGRAGQPAGECETHGAMPQSVTIETTHGGTPAHGLQVTHVMELKGSSSGVTTIPKL